MISRSPGAYNRFGNENFAYFGTGLRVAFLFLLVGLPCRLQAEWKNVAARHKLHLIGIRSGLAATEASLDRVDIPA